MTTSETIPIAPEISGQEETLAPLDLRSLFVAGVHFGHPSKRWNPKMAEYIFGKRSRAHIIDLSKTVTMLKTAKDFVEEIVSKGGECLMVGTKAQAQGAIKEQADKVGAMYINQRWLGGMMTNFQTIQARIERLVYLEDAFAKDTIVAQTKRESLMLAAEVERLNKFFGGIKEMEKLPQVLFIVDIEKENIAVAEARRLGIPIVAIVDTNCDPTQVDFAIPGNDDSVRSITLIAQHIGEAISNGKVAAQKAREERMAAEAELESQEAAARAEAQAKAAERADEAVKVKAEADAKKAAEAKKAEASAPKTKDEPKAEVTKDEDKTASAKSSAAKSDEEQPKSEAKVAKAAERAAEAVKVKAETDAKKAAEAKKAEASAPKTKDEPKAEVTKDEDKTASAKSSAAKSDEEQPKSEAKAAKAETPETPDAKTETAAEAPVVEDTAKEKAEPAKKPVTKTKAAPKAKAKTAANKPAAAQKAKPAPKPKAKAPTKAKPAASEKDDAKKTAAAVKEKPEATEKSKSGADDSN